MEPVVLVGADAASTKTRASLRFTPVESEYPLPEVRKRWCEAAWKMLQLAELDGVFNNELSSEEKYRVAPTPLDTVPLPTVIRWMREKVLKNTGYFQHAIPFKTPGTVGQC